MKRPKYGTYLFNDVFSDSTVIRELKVLHLKFAFRELWMERLAIRELEGLPAEKADEMSDGEWNALVEKYKSRARLRKKLTRVQEEVRARARPLVEDDRATLVEDVLIPRLPAPLPVARDELDGEVEVFCSYAPDWLADDDNGIDYTGAGGELNMWVSEWCRRRRCSKSYPVAIVTPNFDLGQFSAGYWKGAWWTLEFTQLKKEEVHRWRATSEGDWYVARNEPLARLYARAKGLSSAAGCLKAGARITSVYRAMLRLLAVASADDALNVRRFDHMPHVKAELLTSEQPLLSKLLDSFFTGNSPGATIDRQVHTAIRLLVAAASSREDSIRMALATASLEALAARGSQGVSQKLSENIATLLEPDRFLRVRAIKFIADLYGSRSRVLHGEKMDAKAAHVFYAWQLAIAVLRKVMEWRDFSVRNGLGLESKVFFEELEKARVAGTPFGFGEANPATRRLWEGDEAGTA